MQNSHKRAKRGEVNGWSESAARNNTRWLRSVNVNYLDGIGWAFTVTIRDCPPTSDDWHRLIRAFIERMRRRGLLRLHWVTEWQRRGVPHLHGVAYFPDWETLPEDYIPPKGVRIVSNMDFVIKENWTTIAREYGAGWLGQNVKRVDNIPGWFAYLSKHASRGAKHYQRSSANVPEGWRKTGRVWGHCGDWVTDEPVELGVTNECFWSLRRLVRSWRVADARADHPDVRASRIRFARGMLRCGDRKLGSVRGVSEWISMDNVLLLIDFLRSQGHEVDG